MFISSRVLALPFGVTYLFANFSDCASGQPGWASLEAQFTPAQDIHRGPYCDINTYLCLLSLENRNYRRHWSKCRKNTHSKHFHSRANSAPDRPKVVDKGICLSEGLHRLSNVGINLASTEDRSG